MKQYLVTERYDDTDDEYHGWREVERVELPIDEVLVIWPNGSSIALASNACVLTREQVMNALHKSGFSISVVLDELFGEKL